MENRWQWAGERETTDILIDLTMKPMHESKSSGATTPEETHHHFSQCLRACFVGTRGVAYDTSEETRVVFAEKVYGKKTILGAREIRGLWRIYPLSRPARSQLLIEGLSLRGHALPLYDKNPFILKGQYGKERPTTKLWISNISITCDGADTESAIFCYRIW